MEKQQNYRQVEQLLHEGMLQAVRSLVPVKSILKDFVHQGQEEEEDKEDKEEEDPQEQKEQKEQAEKAEKEKAEKEKAEKEKAEKAQVEKAEKAQVEKAEKAQVEKAERAQVEKAERAQAEKEQEKESNVLEPSDPFEESADATDPPTIVVNDKPNVRFGQFHAMFDSQDGDQSELVYDEGDVSEVPDQGIAVTLEDPDSFDLSAAPESVDDYEEL